MAHWYNLRTEEMLPTGPDATMRLEAEQAETRSLNGWTLQTSSDLIWPQATFADIYPILRDNIYEFCYWAGAVPTGQQCMLLDLVQRGDQRIAVKSGQGPGKTTVTTWVGDWWTMKWLNATTLITAPSMHLAQKVWIAEARRTWGKMHPALQRFIQPSKSYIQFGNAEKYPIWRIICRTGSSAEGIAGQHENHMNIIVEEASGVEDSTMETLFGTGTNEASDWNPDATPCCYLLIGNPTRCEGMFYSIFNDPRVMVDWSTLTFDAERCPIVSREKVAREARIYGRNSTYFRVRVKGDFPDEADNLLFRYEDLEVCKNVPVRRAAAARGGELQWGHDLARQGGDETVSYLRVGNAVVAEKVWTGIGSFEPATAIRWAFRQDDLFEHTDPEDIIHVFDAVGVGQGVVHLFVEHSKNYYMFHSQGTPLRPKKYKDQITEAWFELAKLVREHRVYVPEDPVLWQQLTSRRYLPVKTGPQAGKWMIEPKDQYEKRVQKGSPDRADALVMAFYNTGASAVQFARKG